MNEPTSKLEGTPSAQPVPAAAAPAGKGKAAGWIFKTLFVLAILSTVLVTAGGAATFWFFSRGLPSIITVADYRPLTVTRILGNGGKDDALMAELFRERRYVVPYEKIPEVVVKAFISAEDDKFFEHQGVNLASIIRASIANFRAGHVVQGGSTITQQVAKSLLLTRERSFVRKIKEVILAHRIETNLTKQQILYLYLNQIYLGHGAHGIQAAAKTYFRKDASELTLAEAAVLAGMPQAPGKYSPNLNPQRAKERQLYVLRRMYENKFITQNERAAAAAEPLKVYEDEDLSKKTGAYLVEHVRRYLQEKYGDKAVLEDGLTVSVLPGPELCKVAQNSLREGLRAVDKRIGYRGPLKKLKTDDEIETVLKAQRLKLIQDRLGFQTFLPDGRIDWLESLKLAEVTSEANLLDPDETYEAVVTSVDDKKKTAFVMIGAIRAELPMEHMKWARLLKEEKGQQILKPEPTIPSAVVDKGDLVVVKLVKADPKVPIVGLEQYPQVQGALFSVDSHTGQVLAMEGGYDFKQSEFNRATQAQRQSGSSFKPIIYAAGLEKGYSPATIIVDSPIVYEDGDNGKWKPANFEEKFYGDTTFRQALIKSRNVPTIKIVQGIQIPFLTNYAKRLGLNGTFPQDLSISLGSATFSLFDLTKTYALFPRLGRKLDPVFISRIVDRDGKVLEENNLKQLKPPAKVPSVRAEEPAAVASAGPEGQVADATGRPKLVFPEYPLADDLEQVLDPRVAFVMTHLMKEVVNYGTGHEAKNLGRAAAGKTGTTNDYLDAWFMGFTPHVVTGVWVGFDNQKQIGPGETGARAALPIWLSYMREAVKPYPEGDFQVPPGIVFASIDPASGKLSPPNSSRSIQEAFIEGTEPTESADNGSSGAESQSDFLKEDIE